MGQRERPWDRQAGRPGRRDTEYARRAAGVQGRHAPAHLYHRLLAEPLRAAAAAGRCAARVLLADGGELGRDVREAGEDVPQRLPRYARHLRQPVRAHWRLG